DVLQTILGRSELYQDEIVLPADADSTEAHELLAAAGFTGSSCLTATSCVEDLELWCRIAAARPFGIASVPDVLLAYRVHPQQKSRVEHERATAQATVVLWMYIKEVLGGHLPEAV